VGRFLYEWLDDPPDPIPEPPPVRRGFLTLAEVRATPGLAEWRRGIHADLQVHTTYSDGKVPLEGMVEAAAERGHAFVGITDHSVGLPIANGMSEERLAQQAEHIARLNDDLGGEPIRVLHSIEMNLSPEGDGDMDPAALARLDLVLGTFHSQLRITEDQTERYLAAVRNPTVHVLAHPRCRMFNRRLGLRADWPRVFAEAAALDKAVEIDANPNRQDLDAGLLEHARDAGVRISIGTDAHSVGELDFLEFGLAAAIRGGIDRGRILNFQPPEDVLAWAAEVRERLGGTG
jgi:histidinol phosphatase-like PHP family hydrolase